MAVSKTATKQVAQSVQEDEVHVELARCSRYMYNDMLYTRGTVYVFSLENARHIFSLRDPQGLPVFIRAKPRTKLVEVPLEVRSVSVKSVSEQEEVVVAPRKDVAPIGKLDLGDDDPEIIAKLAAIDASPELVDTAVKVEI